MMPDAATLAVLRDVISIALIALLVGAGAYAWMRRIAPFASWNYTGKVASRPYEWPDAVVAALLTILLTSGILMPAASTGSPVKALTGTAASEASQLGTVASTLIWSLTLAALVVGFLRALRERDPAELFGLRRLSLRMAAQTALIWMVPTFFVVMAVSAGATALLQGVWPDLGPQAHVQLMEATKSPLVKLLMGIAAIVVAPLTEELMFRGFLFGVLKRYTDTYFAGLVSAVLFASIHAHIGSFLPLLLLGVILVAAYEVTGCLLVTIFMHALFNGTQIVLMLFGKA